MATHSRYLELGAARTDPPEVDLLEFLDMRIVIPRVPSAATLARILERRIARNIEDTSHAQATLSDAVTEQAVEALFDFYSQGASLRKSLQTVHIALSEAVSDDDEAIHAGHIAAAQQA